MSKLKAFLSSAQFEDEFIVERQGLQLLFSKDPLQASYNLWKIENQAAPHGPRKQYIDNVKDSDILVLLLADKYRDAVKCPKETIIRRYKKGIENFFKLYMPITANWTIYDNSYAKPILAANKILGKNIEIISESAWRKIQEVSK